MGPSPLRNRLVFLRNKNGYRLYGLSSRSSIISGIQDGDQGRLIALGDKVESNGRMFREGASGVVLAISEPSTGGRTDDVIDVRFEGESGELSMKFKDLK